MTSNDIDPSFDMYHLLPKESERPGESDVLQESNNREENESSTPTVPQESENREEEIEEEEEEEENTESDQSSTPTVLQKSENREEEGEKEEENDSSDEESSTASAFAGCEAEPESRVSALIHDDGRVGVGNRSDRDFPATLYVVMNFRKCTVNDRVKTVVKSVRCVDTFDWDSGHVKFLSPNHTAGLDCREDSTKNSSSNGENSSSDKSQNPQVRQQPAKNKTGQKVDGKIVTVDGENRFLPQNYATPKLAYYEEAADLVFALCERQRLLQYKEIVTDRYDTENLLRKRGMVRTVVIKEEGGEGGVREKHRLADRLFRLVSRHVKQVEGGRGWLTKMCPKKNKKANLADEDDTWPDESAPSEAAAALTDTAVENDRSSTSVVEGGEEENVAYSEIETVGLSIDNPRYYTISDTTYLSENAYVPAYYAMGTVPPALPPPRQVTLEPTDYSCFGTAAPAWSSSSSSYDDGRRIVSMQPLQVMRSFVPPPETSTRAREQQGPDRKIGINTGTNPNIGISRESAARAAEISNAAVRHWHEMIESAENRERTVPVKEKSPRNRRRRPENRRPAGEDKPTSPVEREKSVFTYCPIHANNCIFRDACRILNFTDRSVYLGKDPFCPVCQTTVIKLPPLHRLVCGNKKCAFYGRIVLRVDVNGWVYRPSKLSSQMRLRYEDE